MEILSNVIEIKSNILKKSKVIVAKFIGKFGEKFAEMYEKFQEL